MNMRKFVLAGLLAAGGLLTAGLAGTTVATNAVDPRAWTELDIVPMPKHIRLTDNDLALDPASAALVIGENAAPQSRIGAEWINQRLAEAGGAAALPILTGNGAAAGRTLIIIGTPADNPAIARAVADKTVNVGDNNPGARGYEIRRSADGRTVFLAGGDNLGALYACVTFGELLERRDGQIFWRAAEVRDWPDLLWLRFAGKFTGSVQAPELWLEYSAIWYGRKQPAPEAAAAYLAGVRRLQDQLLRRKYSLLQYSHLMPNGLPFADKTNALAIIRQGIEYGQARGIEPWIYAEHPLAGRRQLHPDLPEDRIRCGADAYHDSKREWIRCWSLDDMTRATARNLAEFIRASGVTQIGFHDTDGGGLADPALWSSRCAVCRERWGDDYAAATINKHRIYYDEIKRLNPDVRLHFSIYPYHINIFDLERGRQSMIAQYGDTQAARDLADKYHAQYSDFWRRLHAAFPVEDVTFAIRENVEPAVRGFHALAPGRGTMIGLALMSHAWRPFFSEAASWAGTFVENTNDFFGWIAYNDGPNACEFMPLEALAVREYTWNKATPGARPWALLPPAEQWRHAEPKGEIYEVILPRLARNYFGRQAASHIVRAVSQNVNLEQIYDRHRKQFSWLNDAERMQWQADNAAAGVKALDEFWAQCRAAGDWQGMDAAALRRLVILRERLHLGMWVARARAQNLRARELAARADMEGAAAAVAQGLEHCRGGAAARAQLLAERPDDPILARPFESRGGWLWRGYSAESYADEDIGYQRLESRWGGDIAFVEERLQRTRTELPALCAAAGVPREIIQSLQTREVIAGRAPAGFAFDPGAAACRSAFDAAPATESFLVAGRQLAQAHTRVRLLYDDTNLYLSATAWPATGQAVTAADSIEVFLLPPGLRGDYLHFFLDAGGKLRQQYNKKQKLAGTDAENWQPDYSWEMPGIAYIAQRTPAKWQAWLKIPWAGLGQAAGGQGCQINLGRISPADAGGEVSSIMLPEAKNFHDLAAFRPLVCRDEPGAPLTVRLHAPKFEVKTMTLPHAVASVASFRLEINAGLVLHGVQIEAEAYDAQGQLQRRQKLAEFDRLWYRWQADADYIVEYDQTHEQGGLLIKVVCEEGAFEQWFRFGGWEGAPAAGRIYTPDAAGTQALQAPCYFPDRLTVDNQEVLFFNGPAGTVEFWMAAVGAAPRPSPAGAPTDIGRSAGLGDHTLLHYGPPRADHPRQLNNAPLAIQYSALEKRFRVSMLNQSYAGWLANAPAANLAAGRPRHLAVVWEAAAEPAARLRIYLDGKQQSGPPSLRHAERLADPVADVMDAGCPYAIQIGALNNGRDRWAAAVSGLRISACARYTNDFTAPPGPLELDVDTRLLVSFKGNLRGAGMTPAGVQYPVDGRSGAVWAAL